MARIKVTAREEKHTMGNTTEPLDQVAAFRFAANVLRTEAAALADLRADGGRSFAYTTAARRLDELAEGESGE